MRIPNRFVLDRANIGACFIILALTAIVSSAGGWLTLWLLDSFWTGFIATTITVVVGSIALYRSRHPRPAPEQSAASVVVTPVTQSYVESSSAESSAPLGDTAEFPPVITEPSLAIAGAPPRKNTSSYKVITNDEGKQVLVVEHWRKTGRRKNQSWTSQSLTLRLNDMSLIDTRILSRGVFEPNSDEKVIEVATRKHWWDHTPQQVGVFIAWLVGIIGVGFALGRLSEDPWVWGLGAVWSVFWGVFGFLVWMKWAYTYFIVTDKRILLIYRPPAPFPADSNQSPMSRLQGLSSSEGTVGRLLGFGTIYSETAADKTDEWLKQGVDYLKDSLRIEARISSYTK